MFLSLLLVLAVCIDAFATSVTYGISKIRIPLISSLVVSLIGSGFLCISLLFAHFISSFFDVNICCILSAVLLIFLGISNLFNNCIKSVLRKNKGIKNLKFSLSDISVMVKIILDEADADIDGSKVISLKESFVLSVALSLDSLATGFSFGLNYSKPSLVFILCLGIGFFSVIIGNKIGYGISTKSKIDLSWLCGAILISLGIIGLA